MTTLFKSVKSTFGLGAKNKGVCHHIAASYEQKARANGRVELVAKKNFAPENGMYTDPYLLCKDISSYTGPVAAIACNHRRPRDSRKFLASRKDAIQGVGKKMLKIGAYKLGKVGVGAALKLAIGGAAGSVATVALIGYHLANQLRKEANGGVCSRCKPDESDENAAWCEAGRVWASREEARAQTRVAKSARCPACPTCPARKRTRARPPARTSGEIDDGASAVESFGQLFR